MENKNKLKWCVKAVITVKYRFLCIWADLNIPWKI